MSQSPRSPASSGLHYAWIVLGTVVLVMLAGSGLRGVLSIFIKPIETEFGWDRAALSQAVALGIFLSGATAPFLGGLADTWSARRVILIATALLALGSVLSAGVGGLGHVYVVIALTSLAAGGVGMPACAALVARWFDTRRGLVLGFLGAGSSAGQLILFPLAAWLGTRYGWRASFLWMGLGVAAVVLPLGALLLRDDPAREGLTPYGRSQPTTGGGPAPERRVTVAEATQVPAFWLLVATFFVCGYTTWGVITHLAPHAAEHGFSPMQAAEALGVMGAMNIVGTIGSGWLCDRFGRKLPLATYYGLRGLTLLFLPYVTDMPSMLLFAAIFGLNFISTVPATTAITANVFGRRSVGVLSGWIQFAHQVGGALGVAVAGWVFDGTGSYRWAFIAAALLAFLATALSLAIKDEPLPQLAAPRPAAATT